MRRVAKNRLRIGPIEAIDGTPVIDIRAVLSGLQDFLTPIVRDCLDRNLVYLGRAPFAK